MRFLMFNLVVVGALFYLLTGGDTQQAKTIVESEPIQAAKGRAERIVSKAQQAVDGLAQQITKSEKPTPKIVVEKVVEKKATYKAPVKTQQKPQKAKPSKLAELPPLDGEREVRPHITHEAPDGVSPGVVARQEAPQQTEETIAQVEPDNEVISSEEKRLARKKELSRMVFDMERLFAEKLVR